MVTAPAIRWMIWWAGRLENRRRKAEEQYYYEMDLDLDADITQRRALQLFDIGLGKKPTGKEQAHRKSVSPNDRHQPRMIMSRGLRPERTSYHVNRTRPEAALHKVYIAATVYWPRPLPSQAVARWLAKYRMHIYVVYEVLYHRPSGERSYKLEKVRIVSTTDEVVSSERLDQLKHLVVKEFVEPWIEGDLNQIRVDGDEKDAFFSLSDRSETTQN